MAVENYILFVADPRKEAAFYPDCLYFDPPQESEINGRLELVLFFFGGRLTLRQSKTPVPVRVNSRLEFRLPPTVEVENVEARLKERGIASTIGVNHRGVDTIEFTDPLGIAWQLREDS